MARAILILGDQLNRDNAALAAGDRSTDRVIMIESEARATRIANHWQKLGLIFSAMRHHADWLRSEGWTVDYHYLPETPDFESAMRKQIKATALKTLIVADPNSWFEQQDIRKSAEKLGFKLDEIPTNQFLLSRDDFCSWAKGKKRVLMEAHYRRMRQELGILVDSDGEPEGGRWNFDAENRKGIADWREASPISPPEPAEVTPDAIAKAVFADLADCVPNAPGANLPFWLPATRDAALEWLDQFVREKLVRYGDFQDVMVTSERTLFHSLLSPFLNIGLLSPRECVDAAVTAYRAGQAPLAATEGFVRQIIGWREFVNGVYWLKMPDYESSNALDATHPLPEFFYTGETDLNCLRQTLTQTIESGYNHHIQRLMILGNFLLLAGIRPKEALRWFNEMFVDAHDWVMAANVLGMVLHADGGFMATKPYAASSTYISKMSDYCADCRFKPAKKTGPDACPFNVLYWAFYDRNQDRFDRNPRTAMAVRSWRKRPEDIRKQIVQEAEDFIKNL